MIKKLRIEGICLNIVMAINKKPKVTITKWTTIENIHSKI